MKSLGVKYLALLLCLLCALNLVAEETEEIPVAQPKPADSTSPPSEILSGQAEHAQQPEESATQPPSRRSLEVAIEAQFNFDQFLIKLREREIDPKTALQELTALPASSQEVSAPSDRDKLAALIEALRAVEKNREEAGPGGQVSPGGGPSSVQVLTSGAGNSQVVPSGMISLSPAGANGTLNLRGAISVTEQSRPLTPARSVELVREGVAPLTSKYFTEHPAYKAYLRENQPRHFTHPNQRRPYAPQPAPPGFMQVETSAENGELVKTKDPPSESALEGAALAIIERDIIPEIRKNNPELSAEQIVGMFDPKDPSAARRFLEDSKKTQDQQVNEAKNPEAMKRVLDEYSRRAGSERKFPPALLPVLGKLGEKQLRAIETALTFPFKPTPGTPDAVMDLILNALAPDPGHYPEGELPTLEERVDNLVRRLQPEAAQAGVVSDWTQDVRKAFQQNNTAEAKRLIEKHFSDYQARIDLLTEHPEWLKRFREATTEQQKKQVLDDFQKSKEGQEAIQETTNALGINALSEAIRRQLQSYPNPPETPEAARGALDNFLKQNPQLLEMARALRIPKPEDFIRNEVAAFGGAKGLARYLADRQTQYNDLLVRWKQASDLGQKEELRRLQDEFEKLHLASPADLEHQKGLDRQGTELARRLAESRRAFAADEAELRALDSNIETIRKLREGHYYLISAGELGRLLQEPGWNSWFYQDWFDGRNTNQDLRRLNGEFIGYLATQLEKAQTDQEKKAAYQRAFQHFKVPNMTSELLADGRLFAAYTAEGFRARQTEYEKRKTALQETTERKRAAFETATRNVEQFERQVGDDVVIARLRNNQESLIDSLAQRLGVERDAVARTYLAYLRADSRAEAYLSAVTGAGASDPIHQKNLQKLLEPFREEIIRDLGFFVGGEAANGYMRDEETARMRKRVGTDEDTREAFQSLLDYRYWGDRANGPRVFSFDGVRLGIIQPNSEQTPATVDEIINLMDRFGMGANLGPQGSMMLGQMASMRETGANYFQLHGGAIVDISASDGKIHMVSQEAAQRLVREAERLMERIDAKQRERDGIGAYAFSDEQGAEDRVVSLDSGIARDLRDLRPLGNIRGDFKSPDGKTLNLQASDFLTHGWGREGSSAISAIAGIRDYQQERWYAGAYAVGNGLALATAVGTSFFTFGGSGFLYATAMGALGASAGRFGGYYVAKGFGMPVSWSYQDATEDLLTGAALGGMSHVGNLMWAKRFQSLAALGVQSKRYGETTAALLAGAGTKVATAGLTTGALALQSGSAEDLAINFARSLAYQAAPNSTRSFIRAAALNIATTPAVEVVYASLFKGGVYTDQFGNKLNIGIGTGNLRDFAVFMAMQAPQDIVSSIAQRGQARRAEFAAEKFVEAVKNPDSALTALSELQNNRGLASLVQQGLELLPPSRVAGLAESLGANSRPFLSELSDRQLNQVQSALGGQNKEALRTVADEKAARATETAARPPTLLDKIADRFSGRGQIKTLTPEEWSAASPSAVARLGEALLSRGGSTAQAEQTMARLGVPQALITQGVTEGKQIIDATNQIRQAARSGDSAQIRAVEAGFNDPDRSSFYREGASRVFGPQEPGSSRPALSAAEVARLAADGSSPVLARAAAEALPSYSKSQLQAVMKEATDSKTKDAAGIALGRQSIEEATTPKTGIRGAAATAGEWLREKLGMGPTPTKTQVPWAALSPEAQKLLADVAYGSLKEAGADPNKKMPAMGIPTTEVASAGRRNELRAATQEVALIGVSQRAQGNLSPEQINRLVELRKSPLASAESPEGRQLRAMIDLIARGEIKTNLEQGKPRDQLINLANRLGQDDFARFTSKQNAAARAFAEGFGKGKAESDIVASLQAKGFKPEEIILGREKYLGRVSNGELPDPTAPRKDVFADLRERANNSDPGTRAQALKDARVFFDGEINQKPISELTYLAERAAEFGMYEYVNGRLQARNELEAQLSEALHKNLGLKKAEAKSLAEKLIISSVGQSLLGLGTGAKAVDVEGVLRNVVETTRFDWKQISVDLRKMPGDLIKSLAQAFAANGPNLRAGPGLREQVAAALQTHLGVSKEKSQKLADNLIKSPLGKTLLGTSSPETALSKITLSIEAHRLANSSGVVPVGLVADIAKGIEGFLSPAARGPRPLVTPEGVVVVNKAQGIVEGKLKGSVDWVSINTQELGNPEGLAQVLRQQALSGTKIFVLQEVTNLKDLQRVLDQAGLSDRYSIQLTPGKQRLAILTSSEIGIDPFSVRVQVGKEGEPVFLKTEVNLGRTPEGEAQNLVIFSVHLKAFAEAKTYEARQEQIRQLRAAVQAESERSGGRLLVVGDFNLVGREVTKAEARRTNKKAAVTRAEEVEAVIKVFREVGLTRVEFEAQKGDVPTNRRLKTGEASTLDFAFVGAALRPESGLRVTNGIGPRALPGTLVNSRSASDHSGIGGTVRVTGGTAPPTPPAPRAPTFTELVRQGTHDALAELFRLKNKQLTPEIQAEFQAHFDYIRDNEIRNEKTLRTRLNSLFKKYELGATRGDIDPAVNKLLIRMADAAMLRGEAEYSRITTLLKNGQSSPAEVAQAVNQFLKVNGVAARLELEGGASTLSKAVFTLMIASRENGGRYSRSEPLAPMLSRQFGLDIREFERGQAATPRAPAPSLEWVTLKGLIKGPIRVADIDKSSPGFKMLPERLRTMLTTPDENGLVRSTPELRKALTEYISQAVAQRIANVSGLPEGSRVRFLDLFSLDKNGASSSKIIQAFLREDAAYLGPGHGRPGGDYHFLYPVMVNGKPLFEVSINAENLWRVFGEMPGVKKSEVIFLGTCSGGLCSSGIAASAERGAQITGKPVIASMGIATEEPWMAVRGATLGVWSKSELEGLVPKDQAYRIFYPDGTSKPISFDEVVAMVIRPDKQDRFEYATDQHGSPSVSRTAVDPTNPLLDRLREMVPRTLAAEHDAAPVSERVRQPQSTAAAPTSQPKSPVEVLVEKTSGDSKSGESRFRAAEAVSREGTGARLADNGRRIDIPDEVKKVLIQAFVAEYERAGVSSEGSPAAKGNVGHMKDHFDFIAAHEEHFRALGVDPLSLRLAIAAHDIGKGFLDSAIASYVRERGKGSEGELAPFLRDFILSHELHSISRVPEVIRGALQKTGIDIDSAEGQSLVRKYSEQVMEAIRLHNGVDVTGDLRAKYPTLTDAELAQVQKAWWPANYDAFARGLGLPETRYGGVTNLVGETLNFADRATLTSPGAPPKLMGQNLGTLPWGLALVEASTRSPAQGNIPLIKAQGYRLEQQARTPAEKEAVRTLVAAAQRMNQGMVELGTNLRGMQERAASQKIPIEEGTLLYQRADDSWIRINGQNKKEAFIEVWNGKNFVAEEKPKLPTPPQELLMAELQRGGLWPPGAQRSIASEPTAPRPPPQPSTTSPSLTARFGELVSSVRRGLGLSTEDSDNSTRPQAPQMFVDQAGAVPIRVNFDPATKRLKLELEGKDSSGRLAIQTIRSGLEIRVDGKAVPLDSDLSLVSGKKPSQIEVRLHGQPIAKYDLDTKTGALRDTGAHRKLSPFELRLFDQRGSAYVDEWTSRVAQVASGRVYTPKMDVHTHFGGAIRSEVLIDRALERQIHYPTRLLDELGISYDRKNVIKKGNEQFVPLTRENISEPGLRKLTHALSIDPLQVRGFIPMEKIYAYRAPIVKDPDSFAFFLRQAALDYQRMGVRYVESSISDITKVEWLREAHRVLPEIEKETGVKFRFVVGLWRLSDTAWNIDQIARVKALDSPYIVGVDFMGHEINSSRAFEDQIRAAAAIREIHPEFQVRVHAGENPLHPENVRVAIEAGATRIGHGLYGIDDDTLKLVVQRGVIIEFNQNSNMALNNISNPADIPIKRYLEAGARVTLGTDGHAIYHTSPRGEADAAQLAGLTKKHLEQIARSDSQHMRAMEQMFARRMKREGALTVDASRIPAATYTKEYETRVNQERAERLSTLRSSLAEERERGGVRGTIRELSSEQAQAEFKGMTPIMFSGASQKSWPLVSPENQKAVTRAIETYLSALDPSKVYLVTGATNFGVEKIVHEVGRQMGFKILGTLVEDARPSDIGPITHAMLMGNTWYDKTAGALAHVKEKDGRVVFIGGGNILRDEIQAARNGGIRFDLMDGPEGASTDAARIFSGNAFKGVRELVLRTLSDHPAASQLIRDSSLERLSFEPVSKQAISYQYGGRITDASQLPQLGKTSYAVNDVEGLRVVTYTADGKETAATAKKGDIIMTGPNGEQYIVAGAKFSKLYQGEMGKTVIPEQGPRQVARYDGPDGRIMASFGEVMVLKKGDYVVNGGDGFYRIGQDEFRKTYNSLKGESSPQVSPAPVSRAVSTESPSSKTAKRRAEAYGESLAKATSEPHPGYFEFKNFNDGMRAALSWLALQGYSGQLRDFKPGKFDPSGMPSSLVFRDESGNLIKIRIEIAPLRAKDASGKDVALFGGAPRAHINVAFGKKDGPHFLIPGGRAEVDATLRQLLPTFGPQEKLAEKTSGTPLPRTPEERFARTAEAVKKHFPEVSAETLRKIQELVETQGHFNRSGVVTHGEANFDQLIKRTRDIRAGLVGLGLSAEVAKKITSEVIRGGAAGEAAAEHPRDGYQMGEVVTFRRGSGKESVGIITGYDPRKDAYRVDFVDRQKDAGEFYYREVRAGDMARTGSFDLTILLRKETHRLTPGELVVVVGKVPGDVGGGKFIRRESNGDIILRTERGEELIRQSEIRSILRTPASVDQARAAEAAAPARKPAASSGANPITVGVGKFEDFYRIYTDGINQGDRIPFAGRGRSPEDPRNIVKGEVISYQTVGSEQVQYGRYLGMYDRARVRIETSPGREIVVKESEILSLRKGRSHPQLHAYTPEDVVALTYLGGKVVTGKILGYSADGSQILFLRQGEQQVRWLDTNHLKTHELVQKGWALPEGEMRALPDAASPKIMADPKKPAGRDPSRPEIVNRDYEFPYRLPPEAVAGTSQVPFRAEQLRTGVTYLWVIREDGVMVIAPETSAGRAREIKHRDLVPSPDGTRGQPARLGGEFQIVVDRSGKRVVRFKRDSSYVFARTDGIDLRPERMRESARSLGGSGGDFLESGLPKLFSRLMPKGFSVEEIFLNDGF